MGWQDVRTTVSGWLADDKGNDWFSEGDKTTLTFFAKKALEEARENQCVGLALHMLTDWFRNEHLWLKWGREMPAQFKALMLWDPIYATVERAARAAGAETTYCLGFHTPERLYRQTFVDPSVESFPLLPRLTQAQLHALQIIAQMEPSGAAIGTGSLTVRKAVARTLCDKGVAELRHHTQYGSQVRLHITALGRKVLTPPKEEKGVSA